MVDRLDGYSTLKNAHAFIAVAEATSFTKAAKILDVSKASISMQIKKLESELGVRLFTRTTRRITLTNEGRIYFTYCRSLLDRAEEAERAVKEKYGQPFGHLRINAPMSFGVTHLAPVLNEFLEKHPDVSVELYLDDTIANGLNGYDLTLRIDKMPVTDLEVRNISISNFALVASPDYWKDNGLPGKPQDLKIGDALLYTNVSQPNIWHFQIGEKLVPLKMKGRLNINNGDTLLQAAKQGVGYTLLPNFIAHEALRKKEVQAVLHKYMQPALKVYATYSATSLLPLRISAFMDFLEKKFGSPRWESW